MRKGKTLTVITASINEFDPTNDHEADQSELETGRQPDDFLLEVGHMFEQLGL